MTAINSPKHTFAHNNTKQNHPAKLRKLLTKQLMFSNLYNSPLVEFKLAECDINTLQI